MPVFDDRAQLVVAVAEQIGPHLECLALDALDRVAAAIELRVDLLDQDPRLRPPQIGHLGLPRGRFFDAHDLDPEGLDLQHARRRVGLRRVGLQLARPVAVAVDEDPRAVFAALGAPLEDDQIGVAAGQQALRPLLVQCRDRELHRIDLGDEQAQIEALGLGRLLAARHHRQSPPPSVFEPHRHQYAGRIRRRKGVSLAITWLDLAVGDARGAQLGRQPRGVVALGKADRRCDVAKRLVLVEQPRAFEVPPFDAVVEIVKTGIGQRQHRFFRGTHGFGAKQRVGVRGLGGVDQGAPGRGRDLVGRVATKSAKAEPQVVPHDLLEIGDDLGPPRAAVIEFGEIAPHRLAPRVGRVGRERRQDLALCVMRKPAGVAGDQLAVLGGVVDDEIHDHAQAGKPAPRW